MNKEQGCEPIQWRVHLKSPPTKVHRFLATDDGRSSFWAKSAHQIDDTIEFVFTNGQSLRSTVFENESPSRFSLSYFGDSRVTFTLEPTVTGGTDLLLTETGVAPDEREANLAGWVTVLLTLKAAVDFDVDLRNHDPDRAWELGYVDV